MLASHSSPVGARPPFGELTAQLISGGRSNLTFLVADDSSTWVLRRPPLHGLTPSAHDMAREYKVVAALADTAVPVARAVALCNDQSVLGAPFQMEPMPCSFGPAISTSDLIRAKTASIGCLLSSTP